MSSTTKGSRFTADVIDCPDWRALTVAFDEIPAVIAIMGSSPVALTGRAWVGKSIQPNERAWGPSAAFWERSLVSERIVVHSEIAGCADL
jgi:hypothetical protein